MLSLKRAMRGTQPNPIALSSAKCWSRAYARAIAPRKHLRVLPTRTRPSLFGSD